MKTSKTLTSFKFVDSKLPEHEKINQQIASHLEQIVKVVKENLWPVEGIYLTGGYSRGEGTVISKDGKIEFLSDYDVLVETRCLKLWNYYRCLKSMRILEDQLQLPVELSVRLVSIPRRIFYYEMIEEGLCIYGEDSLSKYRFSPIEIDKDDGVRLLFNRMQGLVVAINGDFPNCITEEAEIKIVKESSKAFLATAEALLLLANEYVPTYRGRNAIFEEILRQHYPTINKQLPDLVKYVDCATRWKLDPRIRYDVEPVDLWFTAKNYMLTTLDLYIAKYYRIGTRNDETSLIEQLLTIKRRSEITSNAKYSALRLLGEKKVIPKALFISPSASLRMKASVYCVIKSIDRNLDIDREVLNKGIDSIECLDGGIGQLKNYDDQDAWKAMVSFLQHNYSNT